MSSDKKLKPDTSNMLTLSQINAAITPLRIDVQGLSVCGFEPDEVWCAGRYYSKEKLPLMREVFAKILQS